MPLRSSKAGSEGNPLVVPPPVIRQRLRPTARRIPPSSEERNRMLQFVRHYVAEYNPVPPLPLLQLREHAERVVSLLGCKPVYRDYAGVLINNEMWRESLAAVPYEKRLLLLPKCLRVEDKCPAPFDQFGLLCRQCGLCTIQDLQNEAEKLGYAVLVAEGSAVVTSLIQAGKVEAIVGVSCLGVLERAFPYMESAAVPGLAIPLLQEDCADTTVDLDWVWEYIHLTASDQTRRLDLGALRHQVDAWFSEEDLNSILGPALGRTEQVAREWLGRAGKRWRPFLTVAAFQALRRDPGCPLPADVRKVAVAVECFHKASLIHDDIEDGDLFRYGVQSLHAEHGVPVALNVGDLLIGEGYRLIGSCEATAEQKTAMLVVASEGQRELCRGQGAELCWAHRPAPLIVEEVLAIFRQKTAPAFEVALKLGALYSECWQGQGVAKHHADGSHAVYREIEPVLKAYSEALGIAYQIRDDLGDYETGIEDGDLARLRPSLLPAIAYGRAEGTAADLLARFWQRRIDGDGIVDKIKAACLEVGANERARALLETYKEEAIRSLRNLENPNLKGLLRRVMGRIFNDTQIQGWCKEVELNRNEPMDGDAAGGASRA